MNLDFEEHSPADGFAEQDGEPVTLRRQELSRPGVRLPVGGRALWVLAALAVVVVVLCVSVLRPGDGAPGPVGAGSSSGVPRRPARAGRSARTRAPETRRARQRQATALPAALTRQPVPARPAPSAPVVVAPSAGYVEPSRPGSGGPVGLAGRGQFSYLGR